MRIHSTLTRASFILSCSALSLACAPAAGRMTPSLDTGIPGCYRLSEGAWRTDSLANSFYTMRTVPTEIKLLPSKLTGWDQLQSDSLSLFALELRDKTAMGHSPFTFWARSRKSDSVHVGRILPFAGVGMELLQSGSNLSGILTAFTDSPMPNNTGQVSFPITLQRIECW
jgi:hypothetical protein